jgi:hypothetical protein
VTGPVLPPADGPWSAGSAEPDRGAPGQHSSDDLGALALGLLDPDRTRTVEEHLVTCAPCRRELEDLRAVTALLGDVPAEALLEGPPDSDLVLQRTLRRMRAEKAAERRGRAVRRVAAAVAAVAVLGGGGVAVGRATAPGPVLVTAAAPRPGSVTLQGDGPEGVSMTAVVSPATGWVRLSAAVRGIPAGQRCRVLVLARDGRREIAATWLASARGEREGTQLDGAAIVAPEDVVGVAVENEAGHEFVALRT